MVKSEKKEGERGLVLGKVNFWRGKIGEWGKRLRLRENGV